MEEYVKIDDNTIEKVSRERIDLKKLRNELSLVNDQIKDTKNQPDMIPNFYKTRLLESLAVKKNMLKDLIDRGE